MDQAEAQLTRARTAHAMLSQHLHELEMQAALFDAPPLNMARHIEQTRRHLRELAGQIAALERAGAPQSVADRLCSRLADRLRDLQYRVAELEREALACREQAVPAALADAIAAVRAEIIAIQRQIDQLGDPLGGDD